MEVLLALTFLFQESAEETFKKVEAAVEATKTIRVLFTITSESGLGGASRGTLLMEEDRRLKLSAENRLKDGTRQTIWSEVENGTLRSGRGERSIEVAVDSRQARQNFNAYLSRLGILAGASFEQGFRSGAARAGKPVGVDLKQFFGLTNIVDLGNGPNGTRVLSYDFAAVIKPQPFKWAKIWFDPKTLRIVKRVMRWESEGKEETFTEEYEYQGGEEKGPEGGTKTPPAPVRPEAEQDILFIQARLQVARENLQQGKKQKAIDVLEDLLLSFRKHPLAPDIQRLLEEAKK
ncbi:MAG TPA: hypothetical protein VE981_22505 [Planctomycetota bacterium]|nr:hypothetical protein [Planctomycetota bacterium]